MKEHYHHGNLKQELIETGIRIISEEGFDHLSLRNISQQCGVSHNAIYRHFDSKEQMIDCCREYVTKSLTEHLKKAVNGLEYNLSALKKLCRTYISFYREHPTYYSFLYRNSSVKIVLTTDEIEDNYPPLEIFRNVCISSFDDRAEALAQLIRYWSLMHGFIALVISPNVQIDDDKDDWDKFISEIF